MTSYSGTEYYRQNIEYESKSIFFSNNIYLRQVISDIRGKSESLEDWVIRCDIKIYFHNPTGKYDFSDVNTGDLSALIFVALQKDYNRYLVEMLKNEYSKRKKPI